MATRLTATPALFPRVATDIRFGGGDRLVTSGGPVSLVHVQEPTANLPGILGGAAAIWSPSGLSLNNRARLLSEGFYTSTFGRGELVIGEAILEAQAHYARDGIDKYLLDVYNLIGDPATIMK